MSTDTIRYLHPNAMTVTHHAKQRYLERRGWQCTHANLAEADAAIRDLLNRVAHKCPPLSVRPDGRVCRRYKVGELVFVLDGNGSTVITMFHKTYRAQHKKRNARHHRREESE